MSATVEIVEHASEEVVDALARLLPQLSSAPPPDIEGLRAVMSAGSTVFVARVDGAIGDPRGLPTILHACTDKPAVRRRAVLALAPFEGDEVDVALQTALTDRDWQVRQAAEDVVRASEG